MATTVYVKNISAKTEDKEIKDFFTFCGKISTIDITPEGELKSATVSFEKETAARTALLLNKTQLGGQEITVTGSNDTTTASPPHDADTTAREADDASSILTQEEKPRSRILAEVLAHGYLVADSGLQHAIALDEQHGITNRFVNTLRRLDERTHATDHARAADASYGITQRANSLFVGLGSYFEKASNTPTGKRIVDFYTTSQRQVQDIHSEARRLADLKKEESGGDLYKGLGLDKVLGKFHHSGQGTAAAAEQKQEQVPGAAPANAPAAQPPIKESGTGNPETIH